VTPEFFAVFRESPALGRFFTKEDREAVVLSHAFWRTRFGGDPKVLGRTLDLDGAPHRIVGVAAMPFRYPVSAQAWTPLALAPERFQRRGMNMNLTVLARRKDGVSEAQAVDRVRRYSASLDAEAEGYKDYGFSIVLKPFSEFVAGDLRRPLFLLWGAALAVLLAGCANVASLLLGRAAGRLREMAIRLAVGGSPLLLLRQLLAESVTLGLLGGLAGLALAWAAVTALEQLKLAGYTALELVRLDGALLAYGLAVAVLSGLLFGLAPAWQMLRESHASALARHRRRWTQDLFVAAQAAAALTLVLISGLLLRSLWSIQRIEPGFDPRGVSTAFLLKPKNDPGFLDRLAPALADAPGVEAAALAYPLPFSGGGLTSSFRIRNRERGANEPEWHGEAYFVSPGYFETLRIPLLRGRAVLESDAAQAPVVCVIDTRMAERFFPGRDPIGQEIGMYRGWARIVGVVREIRAETLEGLARPAVYYPLAQIPPAFQQAGLMVRSGVAGPAAIRAAVRQASPAAPVYDVRTMEERIGETLGLRRLVAALLAAFGLIGLTLAAVGLYGVTSHMVRERTPEIGIRLALGARPTQILASFLRRSLALGAAGAAAGLGFFAYAQRWVGSLLYEVKPFDAAVLAAGAALTLLTLAAVACPPARRASRVDPQRALRHE
jgi:predicted permease